MEVSIKDVLETKSSWPQRLARWWVSSRSSRHDAVSSNVEADDGVERCRLRAR